MAYLSVILPVYNVEQYLSQCLESLLAQDLADLEIIAVNDGSTDDSLSILLEYEKKAAGRLFVYSKENGGLSDARNFGIRRATGKYLAFVDSDDFVTPDFARSLAEKAEAEEADLVLCDFYFYHSPEKTVPARGMKGLSDDMKKDALLAPPMAWMRLYSRELFDALQFEKGIFYEDLLFSSLVLPRVKKVAYVSRPLYYYRQREGSIMGTKSFHPKFLDIFTVLDRIVEDYEKSGEYKRYERELELLFIEHLLRSAALRFAPLPQRKELFQRLCATVKTRFPHWRKNPYLPKFSLFFRLTAHCAFCGCYRLVSLLSRLKG